MAELLHIYIADTAGAPMRQVESARLEAGSGIVGDRYYQGIGTFSHNDTGLPDRHLTLIEGEEIETFLAESGAKLGYGDFRRNLVTRGVRLNDLEGKEFRVGDVHLKGIRLCEPCAHLMKLTGAPVLPAMVGRAGLRAQILDDGSLRPGAVISV